METILDSILNGLATVKNNISPDVVVIVILIGYAQKRFVPWVLWKKDDHVDGAWKTAIISLIAIPLWMYLVKHDGSQQIQFAHAFFSYILGTSIYEVALKFLTSWFNKNVDKIGDKAVDTILEKETQVIDTKLSISPDGADKKVTYGRTNPGPRN